MAWRVFGFTVSRELHVMGEDEADALIIQPMLVSSSAACACGLAVGRCSGDGRLHSYPAKCSSTANPGTPINAAAAPASAADPCPRRQLAELRLIILRTGPICQPPCLTPSYLVALSLAHLVVVVAAQPPLPLPTPHRRRAPQRTHSFPFAATAQLCRPSFTGRLRSACPSFDSLPISLGFRQFDIPRATTSRSRRPHHCYPHSSPSHAYTSTHTSL